MSFDDSTSDSPVTRRHFMFALGRDEAFYTTFSCLRLAVANLRRGPNPGLKLAAAYFTRKEIQSINKLYLRRVKNITS